VSAQLDTSLKLASACCVMHRAWNAMVLVCLSASAVLLHLFSILNPPVAFAKLGFIWILQVDSALAQLVPQCRDANPALLQILAYYVNQTCSFLLIPLLVFALMVTHGILPFKLANNVKFHFAKIV